MAREGRARLAAQSHAAAIDRIEAIVRDEDIACDFQRVDGYLVAGIPGANAQSDLERECAAAIRAGLDTTIEPVPITSYDFGPAVRFGRQAQFHPGRYLAGLARAAMKAGVGIHTRTRALDLEGGTPGAVATETGAMIHCGAIVVATNVPFNDRLVIHTKQAAYRTFVIASRIPSGAVPPVLVWDTCDPYHYVRTQRSADGQHDWIIVGGEDHKTGQPDETDPFVRLLEWTRERFSFAAEPTYQWSGQVVEPHDGLAFIGRNPDDEPHVFVVTGDSGSGMTHGTIAGILLTELIAGRDHPWATLYDPSRKSLQTAGTFIRESANFVAQYRDLVSPGEIDDATELANDEGAIVRCGLARHAIYRDGQGVLHEMSAVCPHLGCDVRWNRVEKTWDCPCHGSRFAAADGHVLNGPAGRPLEGVKRPESPR